MCFDNGNFFFTDNQTNVLVATPKFVSIFMIKIFILSRMQEGNILAVFV